MMKKWRKLNIKISMVKDSNICRQGEESIAEHGPTGPNTH